MSSSLDTILIVKESLSFLSNSRYLRESLFLILKGAEINLMLLLILNRHRSTTFNLFELRNLTETFISKHFSKQ